MKFSYRLFGATSLFLVLTMNSAMSGRQTSRTISDEYLDNLVAFELESAGYVLQDTTRNEVYSPLGLYSILSLYQAFAGEGSDARIALEEVLGVHPDDQALEFTKLNADVLKDLDHAILSNSVWYDQKDQLFDESFLETQQEVYDYDLFELDFALEGPERFASFIAEKTDDMITPSANDFQDMRLNNFAVLNTLYFEGKWDGRFTETSDGVFDNEDGTTPTISYMSKEGKYDCYDDDWMSSMRLFYEDGASMVFITPQERLDDPLSLNDLLDDAPRLSRVLKHYRDNEVTSVAEHATIKIPSFKIESAFELDDHLQNDLGLSSLYERSVNNFAPILAESSQNPNDFALSATKQQTIIEVDAEGTKAASATYSFGCAGRSLQAMPYSVDEAFIFILLSASEIPMFVGTVRNLEAK